MYTTKVAGTVDDAGILWKSTAPGKITEGYKGCNSLYDTLADSVSRNGSRLAAGERSIVETEMVGGFEKLVMSKTYSWITYGEYMKTVEAFGSGLTAALPLAPKDTVVIYAETQRSWMLAAYGCWRQGLCVGTIYATLGEEGALFGINQSKCKAVVADAKLLKIMAKIATQFTTLKDVIAIGEPPAEAAEKLTAAGLTIHKMDDLIKTGAEKPADVVKIESTDTAVLMYTSGTTGNPKGVLISHKAILSIIASTTAPSSALSVNGVNALKPSTTYLAYLPLAHIMELAVEVTCFAVGCKIGYGSPGTLTPTALKMKQTTPPQEGDAMVLKPTIFVAAPAVLDKVLIAVKAKFAALSPFLRKKVDGALEAGSAKFDAGGVGTKSSHIIGGKIVFKKVQKLLGGKVEMMLTGSAPLGVAVQKFVQTVFNCPVRQGYGLTETCAATCIALFGDNSTMCVGPPQESACIKLRDWEEGGYKNDDVNGEVGMRRGEILIGGPTVCDGYLVDQSNPDPDIVAKNAEDFVTIDGMRYFCTGDIGQFTKTGNLQIIDRKKDLVKLQMGEYVALSKVENALKNSPYTALPMVYATSSMSYAIALVCPNVPNLQKLATELSVQGELTALCKDPKILEAVLKNMQDTCKGAKLAKFEMPAKIILIEELWTPENEMLTAVQKLKRREIVSKHKAEIDSVYV